MVHPAAAAELPTDEWRWAPCRVNFVAHADENPWLNELDVAATNAALQTAAAEAEAALCSGEWAGLSDAEKASRSPEVHQLASLPIYELFPTMQASIGAGTFVNDWQRQQFAAHGVAQRDPMSVTMASVIDLENAMTEGGDGEGVRHASGLSFGSDEPVDFDALVEEANFLFSASVHRRVMTGKEPEPSQLPEIDLLLVPAELRARM